MRNLHHAFPWFPTDTLRGRVGSDQVRMLGFEFFQLLDQLVKVVIADFGVIEGEIAVFVMTDLLPQGLDSFFDVLARACHSQGIIFVERSRRRLSLLHGPRGDSRGDRPARAKPGWLSPP